MIDYIPAQSIESEQALLAACIVEGISPPCSQADFYRDSHRCIARSMQRLEASGAKVDLPMLYEELTTCGDIESCGGPAYLSDLMGKIGDTRNLDRYSRIVRQYAVLRRTQQAAIEFVAISANMNGGKPEDLVSSFAAKILNISDITDVEAKEITMKESVKRALSRIEDRMASDAPELVGIPTGIRMLDRMTGGMEGGRLIVIAARPSMGKTAMALNIARNAAKKGDAKGLIFSLEMPESSLTNRLLAIESRVPSDSIRDGNLTGLEYTKVMKASVAVSDLDLTTWDTPCNELEIIRKTRKIRPQFVVVDYLQLVRPTNPTGKQNYDIGMISTSMKHLAQEMKIPVILLSQLNREIEKDKRRPRLSDLRDSGQIEQDADWIIFIHQKDGDHQQTNRDVILAKQRDGDCGFWSMEFLRPFQIFQSMDPGGNHE